MCIKLICMVQLIGALPSEKNLDGLALNNTIIDRISTRH